MEKAEKVRQGRGCSRTFETVRGSLSKLEKVRRKNDKVRKWYDKVMKMYEGVREVFEKVRKGYHQ